MQDLITIFDVNVLLQFMQGMRFLPQKKILFVYLSFTIFVKFDPLFIFMSIG